MGELVPSSQRPVAKVLSREQADKFFTSPILQVPQEWRPHVTNFGMVWNHVLKEDGTLALCARMRIWAEGGVELIDILPAFARLVDPAVTAKYRFASDLLADLGAWVNDARKSREGREELARQRNAGTIAQSERDKVRDILRGFMSDPNSFLNRTAEDDMKPAAEPREPERAKPARKPK